MDQLEVYNPSTNEVIERLNYTNHDEINSKIERAHKAFEEWKLVDAHERSAKLYQWANIIDEHQDEHAEQITLEGGKQLAEAKEVVIINNAYTMWFSEE